MNVPFYPQDWDSARYGEFGLAGEAECDYWKKSACGVLCLKMAAEAFDGPNKPVAFYIEKGLQRQAYSDKFGWKHAGLVRLAKDFGMDGIHQERMEVSHIKNYIDQKCLVIVSIPTAFRPKQKTWQQKLLFWRKTGGHLCLVRGYDLDQSGIMIGLRVNHTSVNSEWNWENKLVPVKIFEKYFTGRGVVLWPEKS